MEAASIHFDQQQGKYFKIDKVTGQVVKSHKNGSAFIKFKPQYSGSDYEARKLNQKSFSPTYLTRKPNYFHHHNKLSPNKGESAKHNQSLTMLNSNSLRKSDSFSKGFETRMSHSSLGISDILQGKLSEYCKMKHEARKQNHSPKKGFEGSLNDVKWSPTFGNQISQGLLNTKTQVKPHQTIIGGPSFRMDAKCQLMKQRDIFLKYNAHHRAKENQKQEKQLADRKTNLKILQNLFISKNDKETTSIYM